MKQDAFEARYSADWDTLATWTRILSRPRRADAEGIAIETIGAQFPALYRKVCHHLALARARRYSGNLQERLNRLALQGHQHLYRSRIPVFSTIFRFFMRDFPRAFRAKWRYMAVASALFFVPLIALVVWMGVYPAPFLDRMEPSVARFVETMNAERTADAPARLYVRNVSPAQPRSESR